MHTLITKPMNRKAIAHLFWGAKILIEQGQIRTARKVVEGLPGDVYDYAVGQSVYAEWGPVKSLYVYVFKGIDPNPTPNTDKEMESHRKLIETFSPDMIRD